MAFPRNPSPEEHSKKVVSNLCSSFFMLYCASSGPGRISTKVKTLVHLRIQILLRRLLPLGVSVQYLKMAQKRSATAPYPTNWDPPDLIDYKESTLSALWKGPKVLTSYFVNKIYDYQIDMKEGKGMLGFLFSDPDMGDGRQWEMVRPLGRGGFGSVGLWQRTKDGVVIDEMAIKQADHKPFLDVQDGLAREAVLQKQLNNRNNENILVLRRYKFYTSQRKYRFYLEFCPHGDLERLRSRYRAYRTHLPECLWHLFKSLADVVSEMSQGPWTDLSGNHLPRLDASYMLHMDLKPVNVFLGYDKDTSYQGNDETPGPLSGYPTIKISDFGLANVTNSSDPGNPRDYWGNGTPNFIPPVSQYTVLG